MKITVIGTGYVGLVAGSCFAEIGHNVICTDKNQEKIAQLKQNQIPIYEPGLEPIIKRNSLNQRLSFSTNIDQSIQKSDIIIIAVGTPAQENGSPNLTYVKEVAKQIGKNLNNYKVIITKSTVPIGTGKLLKEIIKSLSKTSFDIASNPEFLKEGVAINDFLKPDRVVIGCENQQTFKTLKMLYAPLVRNNNPIIEMNIPSAELTKYASNAMLATRISFINEISNICDQVGTNISSVRKGLSSDIRIGKHFLYSGIGYGGSCFPKDVKGLIHTSKELGINFSLLKSVEAINLQQKKLIPKRINKIFGNDLSNFSFGIWGLAFKPETDDIREAPSLIIIQELLKKGAKLKCNDPQAITNTQLTFKNLNINKNQISFFSSKYDAIKEVNALILCTEWNDYRFPDFIEMKQLMKTPYLFDGRNLWEEIVPKDFHWFGIGQSSSSFL